MEQQSVLGGTPESLSPTFNAEAAGSALTVGAAAAVTALGIYMVFTGRLPWQKKQSASTLAQAA